MAVTDFRDGAEDLEKLSAARFMDAKHDMQCMHKGANLPAFDASPLENKYGMADGGSTVLDVLGGALVDKAAAGAGVTGYVMSGFGMAMDVMNDGPAVDGPKGMMGGGAAATQPVDRKKRKHTPPQTVFAKAGVKEPASSLVPTAKPPMVEGQKLTRKQQERMDSLEKTMHAAGQDKVAMEDYQYGAKEFGAMNAVLKLRPNSILLRNHDIPDPVQKKDPEAVHKFAFQPAAPRPIM